MSSPPSQPLEPSLVVSRAFIDDGGDCRPRTFNMPVVVHNPLRRQLVLRVCLGSAAWPTTVHTLHDAQDMSGTRTFLLGLQLHASYGANPSNIVLLVHAEEPRTYPTPAQTTDRGFPMFIEMFEKPGDRHICTVPLGFTLSPATGISSVPCPAPAHSQALAPTTDALEPPVLSPPELMQSSSSSSASSSESASPPDFATLEPPFTPDVVHRTITPGNVGAGSIEEDLSFIRTTLVSTKAYHLPAVLHLKGELMDMTRGWNDEELAASRRLVRFDSRLRGPEVHVSFWAISQLDYAAVPGIKGTTVISCIHDEDRDDYVVTSVDILHLLEVVLFAEFGIDERNRIRRNLEGLRPKSISKSQPDTESLFSLIMEFPYPKPRSIEKSLKVFRWSTLSSALNKIMDKFSAVDLSGPTAGSASVPSTRPSRAGDGAVGPYPPRSSSKLPTSRTPRRNARSPHFIHVSSPSPQSPTPPSDDQDPHRAGPSFFGQGSLITDGGHPTHPDPTMLEARAPILVQCIDDDDGRSRVPSVGLPLPSQSSPPLPQQDDAALGMAMGERPRNASLDQDMLMPLPAFVHDQVTQMSSTYDLDEHSSIIEASATTSASAPMDNMGLGLHAPRITSDLWRSLSWSSDGSHDASNNSNYASSTLANALGAMPAC